MGLVRALLPPLRTAARLSPRPGQPLLAAALMRCLTPDWILVRPPAPKRRLAWAEEAVTVYGALSGTDVARSRYRDRLARALTHQAHALLLVGRYEEACTVMDAAKAVPGARWSPSEQAVLLHLRAQAQSGLGLLDEALGSAAECVTAYRLLSRVPAEREPGGLPGALRTYALVMGALGRTEESVAVYDECARLLRAMSSWQLMRVALVRARVFAELTSGLRALGRYQEALAVGREAREAAEVLLLSVPDHVRPLRVRLFTDLARCGEATDDLPSARTAAEEAVAEARSLTGRDRAAGETWLTVALDCLADQLRALAAYDEEVGVCQEAADLCTALAAEQPDAHDPLLAACLGRLAGCHAAAGDKDAELRVTELEMAAYRRAAEREPALHEKELARVLANLSLCRSATGDLHGAIGPAREAVAIARHLAESDWSAHRAPTARCLRVLGTALRRTGDHTAAVAAHEEAESLLEEGEHEGESGRGEASDGRAAELAVTRAGLAVSLGAAARAHLVRHRPAEAVTALRSLLDLTRRTDRPDVHARCVAAFADARAEYGDAVLPAWNEATGEGYPTFVYRWGRDRGTGRIEDGVTTA
ncbi:hypothetical protein [Streptomyces sp. NPDC005548]|uniref:hypothetical protein n=1 Tax=Streptomyces sp. NPDC005548 TaxID=3364724 RepID=UPI0036A7BF92